jgi:hypothetical protein
LEALGIRTLASHTHRRHQPHLSYAVLRSWDLDRVRGALETLPDPGRCELNCHGTLAFPRGRAALAASISADLGVRQECIATTLTATGADLHHNYLPGDWVPHISIATRAQGATLATVVKAVADSLPLTLTVDRAALIDSSTGRTWPLPHVL